MSSAYTSVELPTSVPGIGYTLKHRNAVEQLILHFCKKAIGKRDNLGVVFTQQDFNIMKNRAKCHDMDKLVCSLAYPQLTADYFHRMFNGHHEESMIEPAQKSKYDWIEMIFDMESAKYTKPDKQGGGSYAFACQFKSAYMGYLEPYFQLFGLNVQDSGFIDSIKQSVNRKYYETDLVNAIVDYMHVTHIHLLDGVARIDDVGYMTKYNSPVPFRHPSTQRPNGTQHQRPNQVSSSSPFISRLEMIRGSFEAQLFDYDALCSIPANQVKIINQQALARLKDMGRDYQR